MEIIVGKRNKNYLLKQKDRRESNKENSKDYAKNKVRLDLG